jgi:hypothetical protein
MASKIDLYESDDDDNADDIQARPVERNNSEQQVTVSEVQDPYTMGSLTKVLDNGDNALPQVLITLALEEEQLLDFEQCRRWLQDFPALAKYATVQGIYRSNSTLLILSLPVPIWDWIPDDPACVFIGYVHSQNLLKGSNERINSSQSCAYNDKTHATSLELAQQTLPSSNWPRLLWNFFVILVVVILIAFNSSINPVCPLPQFSDDLC